MPLEAVQRLDPIVPRFLTPDERRMLDDVDAGRGGHQTEDIHALFRRYREQQGPVADVDILATLGGRTVLSVRPAEYPSFSVIGYDAAVDVLRDYERFCSSGVAKELGAAYGRTILTTDPPEHRAMRKAVRHSFGKKYFDELNVSLVQPVVAAYVDAIVEGGSGELYREMMVSYPVTVLHRWMGLPADEETTSRFHEFALRLLMLRSDPAMAMKASADLGKLFARTIDDERAARGRGEPGRGLISEIIAANEDNGRVMDDEELVSFFRLMLPAGAETTSKATGIMVAALLNAPETWERLRADPSLVEQAVDEALRWDSPAVAGNYRVATVDTEVAGVPIPAGAGVHVVINAANRDPARYADPDDFRLDRKANDSLGFGYGIHLCLGRELARVEMMTVLRTLLARLPNLRRDPEHPAPKVIGLTFRWPDHLHARWD